MTVDFKRTRSDLVFMRRRLRAGETIKTSEPAKLSSGFTLTAPVQEKVSTIPQVPTAKHDTVLNWDNPVVQLNRIESAVGSLLISHADYAAWDMLDRTTGFLYSTQQKSLENITSYKDGTVHPPLPEVTPAKFGNRPLVQYHKDLLVVGLRHARKLKRVIVKPVEGKVMTVGTMGGVNVTVPYFPDTVLYLSVVNGCVELRLEKYRGNVHETFRIGTYTPSAASVVSADTDNPVQSFFNAAGRR